MLGNLTTIRFACAAPLAGNVKKTPKRYQTLQKAIPSGVDVFEHREQIQQHQQAFIESGPPEFNADFHADRREALLKLLPPMTTVIIPGGAEQLRNGDVNEPFRQESNFYYLTGFDEPNAVAILSNNQPSLPRFTLIVPPRVKAEEKWTGLRAGVEGARKTYRADAAYDMTRLSEVLARVARTPGRLGMVPAQVSQPLNRQIRQAVQLARRMGYYGFVDASRKSRLPMTDFSPLVEGLRLVKTPYEIALLKRAVDVSNAGHLQAMKTMGLMGRNYPSSSVSHQYRRNEAEIQAAFEHEVTRHGAARLGYPSIVGGGDNATVLHYITNNKPVRPGQLVLMDAGGEYGYYTADVTRTWPISGKFTPEQRAIYDVVLEAQQACIVAVRPGISINGDLYPIAVRKITEGLVRLGIMQGDVNELIKTQAYRKYFMHGLGHMLGLDVHDVDVTPVGRPFIQNLPLRPGMVFTIEPGIYIDPEEAQADGLDPKWWGIGVRIEDDILVTPTGFDNLSKSLPTRPEDIEALMASGKR